MEKWFNKGYYPFNILPFRLRRTINPTTQYSKPIFPIFHYSNIPIGAKPRLVYLGQYNSDLLKSNCIK
jgi:hypothetical protein